MARVRKVPGPGSRRVEERLVEGARAFVTIGPEDPRWTLGWDSSSDLTTLGAFVRLEPPADASDETVAKMKREAERKALRVVVLPRRRATAVQAPREKRPHRRAREVVVELVETANVEDRVALRALCEGAMSKVGL